jgi:hypothetical protein
MGDSGVHTAFWGGLVFQEVLYIMHVSILWEQKPHYKAEFH